MTTTMEPTKAAIPGTSESRPRRARPRSRTSSAGASAGQEVAANANGTFTRNNASQPTKPTSSPPTTGPTAAAEVLAIWIRPSGRVDFTFACFARAPTITTALG